MNGKAAIFSEDGGLISHRRCRLNSTLPKVGVSFFKSTFSILSNFVFQLNISGIMPHLRQSAKRYLLFY